jgi:sugar/nucleoside kinase (ribokinase family)
VRHFEKSYRPDRICSATGAGDTAIAAFLYAVMQGCDWAKCVQLSAAEGASCVETYDSLSGLRSLEELEEKIAGGWEKQTI